MPTLTDKEYFEYRALEDSDEAIHAQVCRELDSEARVTRIEAMADHTAWCVGCIQCWEGV